jgi:hypothetical protein
MLTRKRLDKLKDVTLRLLDSNSKRSKSRDETPDEEESLAESTGEKVVELEARVEDDVAALQLNLLSLQNQVSDIHKMLQVLVSAKGRSEHGTTAPTPGKKKVAPVKGKSSMCSELSSINSNSEKGDDSEEDDDSSGSDEYGESVSRSRGSKTTSRSMSGRGKGRHKGFEDSLYWFMSTYSDDVKFRAHSKPLTSFEIHRLKVTGSFCNCSVLFQLGVSRPSAKDGNGFLSATSCDFLGSLPDHVGMNSNVQLGESLPYCFPINPEFLMVFLDKSIADVNGGRSYVVRQYRGRSSEKITALTEYKSNISQLLHNLFGDSINYFSHPSWIELYGYVLSFHVYRWNKAICNNDFNRLNAHFLLDWEGQGFKSRIANLSNNRQRLTEFQGTVNMLNFHCRACRRFGSFTYYCESSKCVSSNRLLSATAPSVADWNTRYAHWKSARGIKEPKTRDTYERITKDICPKTSGSVDIWPAVLAAQNLIAPQGSPNLFTFAV